MGKRKERRRAAMSTANRRVKLDLFAEPCGETDTSGQNEVGEDIDQNDRAVVPTSPSSSGPKQENPLLLLGQYSDDELEEETSKRPKIDVADGSSSDGEIPDPTEGVSFGGNTDKEIDGDKHQSDQTDSVHLDGSDNKEKESAEYCETDLDTQVNIPEYSRSQVHDDLTGVWKLVMHEDSNQYYYWNTVTGETSWVVPSDLAGQTVQTGIGEDVSHQHDHLSTESATNAYASAVNELASNNLISKDAEEYGNALAIKNENGEVAQMGYDPNQSYTLYSTSEMPYTNPFSALASCTCQLTIPAADYHVSNDENNDKNLGKSEDCYGPDVHTTRLVKFCERLLQRLEALDRSGNRLENHELIMKEIEIRLSDCNALSSYGSSLLPFWWHTESRLKQLESAVSKAEVSHVVPDEPVSKLEDVHDSSLRDLHTSQSTKPISGVLDNENRISISVNLQIEATVQMPDIEDTKYKGISPESPLPLGSEQEPEIVQKADPNATSVYMVPEVVTHVEEDIDMDVEMEVDDETPSGQITAIDTHTTKCPSPLEQSFQSNQSPSEFPPVPSEEHGVPPPPPPDEEWIPPPPPDCEPVPPPPPPEEPPLPSSPPLYSITLACPPYPDQYNTGYPVPSYEYYAPPMAEVTNVSYLAHPEVSHVTGPQPAPYYEPVVTGSLAEVVVDVNPVAPIVYYDVANENIPSGQASNNVGSTSYYIESGPFTYHHSTVPKVNSEHEVPAVVTESQVSTLQATSVALSTQSVGSTLVNGTAMNAVASSKDQTKVRRKKHTVAVAPSLRSNKKVSSLVDKWKAAKEELHSEEEEEPENAVEDLEKKRQKEIEEWRARQIASGEAQDNANFLPLGGDWREKVKRKKAKAKTKTIETSTEVVDNERKQPDLTELSKDLPSGWQAYWDESSKEVYYGNSITSETTWLRPTR